MMYCRKLKLLLLADSEEALYVKPENQCAEGGKLNAAHDQSLRKRM